MASPKYTLYYFEVRGLAEICRLILAQAGVEYVDKRLNKEFEWPELKKDMPFNHVPVLEVNGIQISESRAIARYLAKEHGLAGKNNIEAALADGVVDIEADAIMPLFYLAMEENPAKREELHKKFVTEHGESLLRNLERIMQKHGRNGFLIGDAPGKPEQEKER